jgi:hypothetical protein
MIPVHRLVRHTLSDMPTVLRRGPYRFFFFSADRREPAHVHVRIQGRDAKIWLVPIDVANAVQLKPHELAEAVTIVIESQKMLLGRWRDYFADRD